MSSSVLTTITVAAAGAWLALYLVVWLRSRPRSVSPDTTQTTLGPEPPAVVNLLTHRWRLTDDAAEATLLDLAARGLLHLHQPDPDPASTLIRLTTTNPGHLLPYERRVWRRVRQRAVNGEVPVAALTFRDEEEARGWQRNFRNEVIADARERGLSQQRIGAEGGTLLTTVGGLVAVLAGLLVFRLRGEVEAALGASFLVFALTGGLTSAVRGERDTAAGRQVAARWLGVRQQLASRPGIADVPPAAVHDWDRYLAYGATLGLTRTTSALLDLGMGDARRVWSSYTGSWRRIRVRYPKGRPHLGKTVPGLLLQSLMLCIVAAVPGIFTFIVLMHSSRDGARVPAGLEAAAWVLGVVPLLVFSYVGYCLVRGLIDLGQEREIVGEVLWIKEWRVYTPRSGPRRPILHYLAVDDGTADQTTAWALPSEWAKKVVPEHVVRIRVRPWSRRVMALEVLRRRARPDRDRTDSAADTSSPGQKVMSGIPWRGIVSGLAGSVRGAAPTPPSPPSRSSSETAPPAAPPPPPPPVPPPPAVPPPPGPVS